jgi:Chaperone of endosialidase
MKTSALSTNYIHRSFGRPALLCVSLLLGCFALLPIAQAVSPPPDGGYPGGNTAEGQDALLNLNSVTFPGNYNTAVGLYSLLSNTTGSFNTGVGAGTLLFNTSEQNTATGAGALLNNTGGFNTANGTFALFSNTTGSENTAVGSNALLFNTIGNSNTALGRFALNLATTGNENTATGVRALTFTTHGSFNTATGVDALVANDGDSNTAIGYQALYQNQIGNSNTAAGNAALQNNATGSNNTAIGSQAGTTVTTASNVISIGANVPGADVSNTCFIGNIRDIQTQNADAIAVVVDSAGQLGTVSSSARFKEIKPMDNASEAILALKPVSFHYKSDKRGTPQFGLVAEDVAKVNPDLIVRDKSGVIYTVRYEAVNAMLLNEFLKEHRRVQELEANAARQQKQIEVLTAGLQKVSDQLELSKPAPRTVVTNQ